jgi:hypothetical protein
MNLQTFFLRYMLNNTRMHNYTFYWTVLSNNKNYKHRILKNLTILNQNTVEPLITDTAGEFKFCPL